MDDNIVSLTLQIDGPEGPIKTFRGRTAWALSNLIVAGKSGCTPLTHVGPRWSHYVYMARREGLVIETVTESHGGPYSGHHARYILRTPITLLAREAAE
jgi:hypothetical protein